MATIRVQGLNLEIPPARLKVADLASLLFAFEADVCLTPVVDPRGHTVTFGLQHFPYLLKLRDKNSGEKLKKPLRKALQIREGILTRDDFGKMDMDRAQTLSWLRAAIERPTVILENKHKNIPGDEVYVKEFASGRQRRIKAVVCRRISRTTLEPVTSFRKKRVGAVAEHVLWPPDWQQP